MRPTTAVIAAAIPPAHTGASFVSTSEKNEPAQSGHMLSWITGDHCCALAASPLPDSTVFPKRAVVG